MENRDSFGVRFHFDNEFNQSPQKFGGITLFQFGELYCDHGMKILPHKQWCYEITYVISGEADFGIDGVERRVKEGDVCISPYGRMHSISVDEDGEFRYVYVAFLFNEDSNNADYEFLKEFFREDMTTIYAFNNTTVLPPFLKAMEEFYRKSIGYRLMVEGYVNQILIATCRSFDEHNIEIPKQKRIRSSTGTTLYAVIHYIEDNIFSVNNAKDVTDKLNYDYQSTCELFEKNMDMSLQRYINHKKVKISLDLLEYGKFTVEDVYKQIGFDTLNQFKDIFQDIMDMSIEEYLNTNIQK